MSISLTRVLFLCLIYTKCILSHKIECPFKKGSYQNLWKVKSHKRCSNTVYIPNGAKQPQSYWRVQKTKIKRCKGKGSKPFNCLGNLISMYAFLSLCVCFILFVCWLVGSLVFLRNCYYVSQIVHKLDIIILPQPPKYWDHSCSTLVSSLEFVSVYTCRS